MRLPHRITALRSSVFARCWSGHARLWEAFWLIGVVGQCVLSGLLGLFGFVVFVYAKYIQPSILLPLLYASSATGIAYTIYSSICIWRCANNTGIVIWTYLSRCVAGFVLALMLIYLMLAIYAALFS